MTRYDAVNLHQSRRRSPSVPAIRIHRACRAAPTKTTRPADPRNRRDGSDSKKKGRAPWRLIASTSIGKAREGRIDPLIGRDKAEVQRTIQVLCRRQKNNPLLVGRPWRRQDGDRRGAWRARSSNSGCCSEGARRPADRVRASRHGRTSCRHALSRRRLRGTPQAGNEGNRAAQGRHSFHRRNSYRHWAPVRRRAERWTRPICSEACWPGSKGRCAASVQRLTRSIPAVF